MIFIISTKINDCTDRFFSTILFLINVIHFLASIDHPIISLESSEWIISDLQLLDTSPHILESNTTMVLKVNQTSQGRLNQFGALCKPKFWDLLVFTILNRERRICQYYSTSKFKKQIYSFFCAENKKQISSSNRFSFINITKFIIDYKIITIHKLTIIYNQQWMVWAMEKWRIRGRTEEEHTFSHL